MRADKYVRRPRGGGGALRCGNVGGPAPRTVLLVLFGAVLHALGQAAWRLWYTVGGCSDPANREMLWFLEGSSPLSAPLRARRRAGARGRRHCDRRPRAAQRHVGSLRLVRQAFSHDMCWGDFRSADGVLARPAADTLGRGRRTIAPAMQRLRSPTA